MKERWFVKKNEYKIKPWSKYQASRNGMFRFMFWAQKIILLLQVVNINKLIDKLSFRQNLLSFKENRILKEENFRYQLKIPLRTFFI